MTTISTEEYRYSQQIVIRLCFEKGEKRSHIVISAHFQKWGNETDLRSDQLFVESQLIEVRKIMKVIDWQVVILYRVFGNVLASIARNRLIMLSLQHTHSSVKVHPIVVGYSFQSFDPIIENPSTQIGRNSSQDGFNEFLQRRE
jgi:hypothetical protein